MERGRGAEPSAAGEGSAARARPLGALGRPLPELASRRALLLAGIAVAIAYALAAWWSSEYAVTADGALVIWYPPAGIALASVLLGGPRMGVAIALGETLGALLAFQADVRFDPLQLGASAAGIAVAYTGAGLLAARAVSLRSSATTVRDVAVPAAFGVAVGSLGAALLGTGIRAWADDVPLGEVPSSVHLWLLGDAVGVLTVAPAVVALAFALTGRLQPWEGSGRPVALAVAAAGLLPAAVVPWLGWRFAYVAILPVVAAALLRGLRGAVVAALAANVGLTVGVAAAGSTVGRVDLQVLLIAVAATALAVGALASDRRSAFRAASELAAIVEEMPHLVAAVEPDGRPAYVNRAGLRLLGLPASAAPSTVELARALEVRERRDAVDPGAVVRSADGTETPVSVTEIPAAPVRGLRRRIVIAEDVSGRVALQDELRHRAAHDALTGLANRTRIPAALAARGDGEAVGVAVVDLDRFKVVNDSLGHGAGDGLLAEVARRAAANARGGDLIARLGGDEFALVVRGADEAHVERAVERIVRSIAGSYDVAGRRVAVTASAGLALVAHGCTAEEALRRADLAMYEAKRAGGGRVVPYAVAHGATADRKLALEADLREALARGSWDVAFQPIMLLRSGAPAGAEALFRWTRPGEGPVAPLEAIALAEEIGEIGRLGRDMLARACAAAASWGERTVVAVNIAASHLATGRFGDDLESAVRAARIDASRVVIEVTESEVVERGSAALAGIAAAREVGARVALDDFGTGFASLAAISDIDVDIVKLDRRFLRDAASSPRGELLLARVHEMIRALGLLVVAEGVETHDDRRRLEGLGCRLAQGFHLGMPEIGDGGVLVRR